MSDGLSKKDVKATPVADPVEADETQPDLFT